jgi:hypothetical protein
MKPPMVSETTIYVRNVVIAMHTIDTCAEVIQSVSKYRYKVITTDVSLLQA